jgi:hypothetical protein
MRRTGYIVRARALAEEPHNASTPSKRRKKPVDWLDTHSGSVVAVATFVLVVVTAYYAWTSRALVRETHVTLQAGARATLAARLDRISEICIHEPHLFTLLDDPNATGEEQDARFHIANMLLGVLEEAHMQYRLERTMTAEDWGAWEATADAMLHRFFIKRYWQRVQQTFEPGFREFVSQRISRYGVKGTPPT